MTFVDTLGYLAACLTTSAFIPQAVQVWRTQRTQDLSLGMYLVFTLGVLLWLVYGLVIGAWPVVAANAITLLLALFILAMKVKHG